MKEMDIIIYGFDYETTEKIIDTYTEGILDFTSSYINEGAHREDKLICHLRIRGKCHCPYIMKGMADVLYARTREDADRYEEWVKEAGMIFVVEV